MKYKDLDAKVFKGWLIGLEMQLYEWEEKGIRFPYPITITLSQELGRAILKSNIGKPFPLNDWDYSDTIFSILVEIPFPDDSVSLEYLITHGCPTYEEKDDE